MKTIFILDLGTPSRYEVHLKNGFIHSEYYDRLEFIVQDEYNLSIGEHVAIGDDFLITHKFTNILKKEIEIYLEEE